MYLFSDLQIQWKSLFDHANRKDHSAQRQCYGFRKLDCMLYFFHPVAILVKQISLFQKKVGTKLIFHVLNRYLK